MAIPNYAVILTRNPRTADRPLEQAFWREEVAYWQQLANRGACTMAGNWREWDGGLVLLSVRDDQTAQNIANNDPGVKLGVFVATVRAWEVRVTGSNLALPNGLGGAISGNGGGQTSGGGSTQSSSGNSSRSSGGSTKSGG